jgi:hypothetical protein
LEARAVLKVELIVNSGYCAYDRHCGVVDSVLSAFPRTAPAEVRLEVKTPPTADPLSFAILDSVYVPTTTEEVPARKNSGMLETIFSFQSVKCHSVRGGDQWIVKPLPTWRSFETIPILPKLSRRSMESDSEI